MYANVKNKVVLKCARPITVPGSDNRGFYFFTCMILEVYT